MGLLQNRKKESKVENELINKKKQEFVYFMEKNNANDIHWKRAVVC
jgi:hypothetical protein